MGIPNSETPHETRKLGEIGLVRYGDTINGNSLDCEPSKEGIQQALDEGLLEERAYQCDLEKLKAEWIQASDNAQDAGA